MAVTEQEFDQAEKRMTELRAAGHAVSARYDRRRARVVVALNTGVELTFPARLAEGLADAPPDALTDIEVSAAGLGLHWPKLDTDLYVPALLQGVFGSKQWMAQQLGAQGRPPEEVGQRLTESPVRPRGPWDAPPLSPLSDPPNNIGPACQGGAVDSGSEDKGPLSAKL